MEKSSFITNCLCSWWCLFDVSAVPQGEESREQMGHRDSSVILLALANICSLVHYLCSLLECKPCEGSDDASLIPCYTLEFHTVSGSGWGIVGQGNIGKVHEVLLLGWTGQMCTGLLDLSTGKEENKSEVNNICCNVRQSQMGN